MNGIVKMYDENRGFGFIKADGKDIFFHISDVKDGSDFISKGIHVKFDMGQNEKGEKACNIEIINEQKFIAIGDVRLKMCNIKEYGISSGDTKYQVHVYEMVPYDSSQEKSGLLKSLLNMARTYKYVLNKTSELIDVYNVQECGDGTWTCSLDEAPMFFENESEYEKKWMHYESAMRLHAGTNLEPDKPFDAGSRYKRKIIKCGSVYGHVLATNCEFIKGDYLLRDEDFVALDAEEYLYVTTYQGDNFRFNASEIDIRKYIDLLDKHFRTFA